MAHIIYLPTVGSTNDYLKERPELPDRTAVLALEQTAGKGRLGRSFHSPVGAGMYLSVALDIEPGLLAWLTPAAAVAARRAALRFGVDSGIKWVNDLVCERGGVLRKLCGILVELRGGRAIVGVGMNLSHAEADFPPELRPICTSLALERSAREHTEAEAAPPSAAPSERSRSAREPSIDDATARAGSAQPIPTPQAAAEVFLDEFFAVLARGEAACFDEYSAACITPGAAVEVRRTPQSESLAARALALERDYALIVEYPDGSRERLASGEASVRLGAR